MPTNGNLKKNYIPSLASLSTPGPLPKLNLDVIEYVYIGGNMLQSKLAPTGNITGCLYQKTIKVTPPLKYISMWSPTVFLPAAFVTKQ